MKNHDDANSNITDIDVLQAFLFHSFIALRERMYSGFCHSLNK